MVERTLSSLFTLGLIFTVYVWRIKSFVNSSRPGYGHRDVLNHAETRSFIKCPNNKKITTITNIINQLTSSNINNAHLIDITCVIYTKII